MNTPTLQIKDADEIDARSLARSNARRPLLSSGTAVRLQPRVESRKELSTGDWRALPRAQPPLNLNGCWPGFVISTQDRFKRAL